MPLRKMQVDGSDFEIAMTEQYLNSAQVGTGFEKMCGEAMSQSVRMDVPFLEPGALSGDLAGGPQDLGSDRVSCRVPAVAWEEPLLGLTAKSAPVNAQLFEQ